MAVIEAGGCVVVTPPVTSDDPDLEDQSVGAQLDSLDVHAPEEVEPTEQDRRSAVFVVPEKKPGRRKKLSVCKEVQDRVKRRTPRRWRSSASELWRSRTAAMVSQLRHG